MAHLAGGPCSFCKQFATQVNTSSGYCQYDVGQDRREHSPGESGEYTVRPMILKYVPQPHEVNYHLAGDNETGNVSSEPAKRPAFDTSPETFALLESLRRVFITLVVPRLQGGIQESSRTTAVRCVLGESSVKLHTPVVVHETSWLVLGIEVATSLNIL